MGKLYTVDSKLLTATPDLRIDDKIYPIDNRANTMKKIAEAQEGSSGSQKTIDKTIELCLGKAAAKEIATANFPFPALQSIYENIIAAVTDQEVEEVTGRFPEPTTES